MRLNIFEKHPSRHCFGNKLPAAATRKLIFTLSILLLGGALLEFPASTQQNPDDHDDAGPIQVGYAVVTLSCARLSEPTTCTDPPVGGVVFETFGLKRGIETTQAAVIPSGMTMRAVLFANASPRLSRDLGVAIVNPGNTTANMTLTLTDEGGAPVGSRGVTLPARQQTSRFVTELFSDVPNALADLKGILTVSSDTPVAVTGLRFRGANFSTLPITSLSASTPVPQISTGVGGSGAVILPQYAVDGGWSSEIVIMNTGRDVIQAFVTVFKPDGTRLTLKQRGVQFQGYSATILPGRIATLAPRDGNGDSRF